MGMVLKVSTNEARLLAHGLGAVIHEVEGAIATAQECEDFTTDGLLTVLSTQHRAVTLYKNLWLALGMEPEAIEAQLEVLTS